MARLQWIGKRANEGYHLQESQLPLQIVCACLAVRALDRRRPLREGHHV